jgi:hypothetical protein|tara:strand:- start:1136 stop:1252 length:117 start_codon:yes stop_codon:yes gene_type:complete
MSFEILLLVVGGNILTVTGMVGSKPGRCETNIGNVNKS